MLRPPSPLCFSDSPPAFSGDGALGTSVVDSHLSGSPLEEERDGQLILIEGFPEVREESGQFIEFVHQFMESCSRAMSGQFEESW